MAHQLFDGLWILRSVEEEKLAVLPSEGFKKHAPNAQSPHVKAHKIKVPASPKAPTDVKMTSSTILR